MATSRRTRGPADRGPTDRRTGLLSFVLIAVAALVLPAAVLDGLSVTGQVLYGKAEGATRAGVVDILAVYAQNPVYMRMQAEGLSQTDGARGSKLFAEAQATTSKALIKVARSAKVDVVTVPGGASGGSEPIPDLTQAVIDLLPVYNIEGKVLTGAVADARLVAELSSSTLLAAIPAYREVQLLNENDVNYHFLRKQAQDQFEKAVKKAARDGGFDAVIEKGGVISRLGPVPDITSQAIAALTP